MDANSFKFDSNVIFFIYEINELLVNLNIEQFT